MEFRTIERAPGAFQQPVPAERITAMARRAFGAATEIVSAEELAGGRYNTTYRVDIGHDRPVILRIAPPAERQGRIEHALMRNEHASLPYFAPIAAMMPRTLAVDWTHDLIGRDYVWQTMLDGEPAVHRLRDYPRPTWAGLYRQLGTLARQVHAVRGERFGPVAGPTFPTWRQAMLSTVDKTVADLADASLDTGDLRQVMAIADNAVLDEIVEPRLLHGDLWVPNVMLAAGAPEPTITGVFDHDRASWGDPAADWSVHVVGQRPEREPFWDTYGRPDGTDNAVWRGLVYRAMHLGAARLERHRLGEYDKLAENYDQLRDVLTRL
ncbi:MAG TPA: aminoglycoside phosphotransferase family protein [Pseudonocardiaceae bacterium]